MDIENLLSLPKTELNDILYHLNDRYQRDSIYTYAGKILIAINPFKVTDLYSEEMRNIFLNNMTFSKPHLYEVANDAIISDENKISFLISGESGSGKTESTKKLLDYFSNYYKDIGNIIPMILDFNHILEAFGNASTIRNHNSSRFGKYITININRKGEISSKIKTYLLEKIRVVAEDLNNYHIFYSFGYQNNKPDYLKNTRDDWDSKYLMKENLRNIWIKNGLDESLWLDIEKTISFIIGLLENKLDDIFFKDSLNFLSMEEINNVISYKTIRTGDEEIKMELSIGESKSVMQTICMTLYDKLFERVVGLINEKLGDIDQLEKSYGILDIFGFEVFGVNRFEQLCINYTNERLQSIFNRYVFEEEIKIFEEEGILKSRVSFESNSHILDYFDKKGGFFSLLDEKSILSGNDGDLERSLQKNDRVIRFKIGTFMIKHYAENVEYEWGDFSVKNIERANSDILDFCNKIYKNLGIYSIYAKKGNRRGSIGNQTITNQFRMSLNSLVDELELNKLYFIRCIKPNEENRADHWVSEKVIKQLNYCGIINAIELARQSFPVRMYKDDFLKKYEPIYLRDNVEAWEWMRSLDGNEFLLGLTRVFYTKEKDRLLNTRLVEAQKLLLEKIIFNAKMKIQERKYQFKLVAFHKIRRNYLCFKARKELLVLKSKVRIMIFTVRYWDRLFIINNKKLVMKLERAILERKKRQKAMVFILMRLYCSILRRKYMKKILSERESLEGMINLRVENAKSALDMFYKEKIERLESRVRELEKYEGLYNDLSGIINQNNESMMVSKITKTRSDDSLPLIGEESGIYAESLIIRSNSDLGFIEERGEYLKSIQNLTQRLNQEYDKFEMINRLYESIQYEYQNYKSDIRNAQLLMSEKLYNIHNENVMLREENARLVREFNRSYTRKFFNLFNF